MNLSMKQKQTHRPREQTMGGGGGGTDGEFGTSRYKLLYIGCLNNKVLLYSTGNYIQYPVINHIGKKAVCDLVEFHDQKPVTQK